MQTNPGLQSAIAGRYVIDREVGAGGMARVFLAHDIRHDRRVALKVLRAELAAVIGAQRFLAEIRTTANLQHPHILPLYDSGEADGTVFYVMPYVDGESLRELLDREKQLPVPDAIRIAAEVADALDYAHRHNVVHRDIKPENILLQDGRALIADFGIALAVSRVDSASRLTETGMSLGTPHYMSPEQAMGERDITFRSDIYALGCVLYEMLLGEPPFTGPTAQAIVARVVTEQPRSLITQRRTVPIHIEIAVHRAIEKLPADRFPSAAAFATALRDGTRTTQSVAAGHLHRRNWSTVILGTAVVLLAAVSIWGWMRPEAPPNAGRYRMHFALDKFPVGLMGMSASGDVLLYAGPPLESGRQQLYAKHTSKMDPDVVPGVEQFGSFGVSPDGESVVYTLSPGSDPGPLKRQQLAGGTPITLADSAMPFGSAWLQDGNIVFVRVLSGKYSLWKIAAAGGKPVMLWAPDSAAALVLPTRGPDGQVFVVKHGLDLTRALWTVDVETGAATKLIDGALHAFWASSGYVTYATVDGDVFSIGYDARARRTTGSSSQVLENVQVWNGLVPLFTMSESGVLVGRVGPPKNGSLYHAVFVDRDGRISELDSTWSFNPFAALVNVGLSLSSDGTKLAIGISDGTRSSIWIKSVGTAAPSRLTFDGTDDARPRWTPDGKAITFIRSHDGKFAIFSKNANGIGGERLIASSPGFVMEAQYSSDMQWLVTRVGDAATHSRDIYAMHLGTDSALRPLIASPKYDESSLALSPDGKWIAYQSDETGTMEVFIRRFPDANAGKWQVSRGGGLSPLWNPKGGELFFITYDQAMMSVRIGNAESPEATPPRRLFKLSNEMYVGIQESYAPYAVSADGGRFVMLRQQRVANDQRSIAVLEHFLGK